MTFSSENLEFFESMLKQDPSWALVFGQERSAEGLVTVEDKTLYVEKCIMLYRLWGHLQAKVYPEGIKEVKPLTLLQSLGGKPGLFPTCGLLDAKEATLDRILQALEKIYSSTISYEFWPFCDEKVCRWLIEKIETPRVEAITRDEQFEIVKKLSESEVFETFLHTRYVGQKRFSIEGAETLIPMLSEIIELSECDECIIGMPHRGRLNVMVNLLNKSFQDIFIEFEDIQTDFEGSGDVKYHKGYSSEVTRTNGKNVKVTLAANPSHLESVDAVVEGMARAKKNALPVLVHGDAAISGQGIVYETLQLSRLSGYKTGGTIHIVINNHIGFTTLPEDSRSNVYCTDIAKSFGMPIFHVNAEDPEACLKAVKLAVSLRDQLHTDVCIDLNCYRKYGHNESDEPAFTQPLLYQKIRKKPSIRSQYIEKLGLSLNEVKKIDEDMRRKMQGAHIAITNSNTTGAKVRVQAVTQVDTRVSEERLHTLLNLITQVPEGFSLHPRIQQQFSHRMKSDTVDWAGAESLAFASLLQDGVYIRCSGQDTRRGTFSQRHGMLVDQETEARYFPLESIRKDGFELIDSPLSEFAALGFEYGFSIARPDALVIWEAQFGDFANGAQVLIDQYIASGEQKWGSKSRLALFLPHGYEGQGPEHSSARIERFLTLCACNNICVTHPTTPSQFFHLLRRQALEPCFKPLIVFTPKGLLRYPKCQSALQELATGQFHEILYEENPDAKKVIFCQGRVYYDLLEVRKQDTVIVRIEQLYPFETSMIEKIISYYALAQEYMWVQEEPENMGAWNYIKDLIRPLLPKNSPLVYRGRPASSSPAVGSHRVHNEELKSLMESL